MKNKIQWLIIHTEASPVITNAPRFEIVNQEHRRRDFIKSSLGWYVGYHYFCEKSGKRIQAKLDEEEGCHTIGYNKKSLAYCMAGNGDEEFPTKEQIADLKNWINEKAKQYNIPKDKIKPHRYFLPLFEKTCYGRLLLDDWAANLLEEKPVEVKIEEIKKQLSLYEKIVALLQKIIYLKTMDNRRYGAFSSSVNPEKLALSIKGLIVFVPSAVALAKLWNVDISENDLTSIILTASLAISQAGTAVGTGMTLWGLVRKLLVKLDLL